VLPIKDINPVRRVPWVTYFLLLSNVLVFIWEQTLSPEALQEVFLTFSVVPSQVAQNPLSFETALDVLRSMFFHGGWLHLGGNMLYLYLFGDNVEDWLGKIPFIFLYLCSGVAAVAAQVIVDPTSQVPLVGASGAIAGVLGSYLLLFPGIRVRGLILLGRFARIADMPAWLVLGMWFVMQVFNGLLSLGVPTGGGGVAFFAHIGGFVVGLVLTGLCLWIFPHRPAKERKDALYERVLMRYGRGL